jgi:hypothetical protein
MNPKSMSAQIGGIASLAHRIFVAIGKFVQGDRRVVTMALSIGTLCPLVGGDGTS